MATTKTTAAKKATPKAASTNNTKLEQTIQQLESRVTDLENQLANVSTTPEQTAGVTVEQVASALRSLGARDWVIRKLKE